MKNHESEEISLLTLELRISLNLKFKHCEENDIRRDKVKKNQFEGFFALLKGAFPVSIKLSICCFNPNRVRP